MKLIAIEKKQRDVWSIGVYAMLGAPDKIKIIPHPQVRNPVLTAEDVRDLEAQFVADPFLVERDGYYYIFFEVLIANRGVIGLAKSSDGIHWNYEKIILKEPFHLSYPYIFSWEGRYYMIPESYKAKSIRLYRAINFPNDWQFVRTLLEGKDFVDPSITFFQNKWWLFASTTQSSDLYLYYADKLEGLWLEHPKNPIVKGDMKTARCGGSILQRNGKLIRLAQDDFLYHNDPLRDYGSAVRALEIIKLSTTDYLEKEIEESPLILPNGKSWNKDGMHHLSTCTTHDKIGQLACADGKRIFYTYYLRLQLPRLIGRALTGMFSTISLLKRTIFSFVYLSLVTMITPLRCAFNKLQASSKKTDKESICIIAEPMSFGGSEIHTLSLIEYLLKHNYSVEFICCLNNYYSEKTNSFNPNKFKMINTNLSISDYHARHIKEWDPLLKNMKSAVLIIPRIINDMGSIPFLNLCRKHFRKICYIEHALPEGVSAAPSRRWFGGLMKGFGLWWRRERLVKKMPSFYADCIITISNAVARSLIRECGYPAHKISVIYNGINSENYIRDMDKGHKFRSQHNISTQAFVFGMLARLNRLKGVDIALRAFYLLCAQKHDKDVVLLIAGEGEEEAALRRLTDELGISDHVRFLGFIQQAQNVLWASDVILFSSRKEGLSIALLEGMAAGCLPIISDVGGMSEVVKTSDLGWVVPSEDPKALYVAMSETLQLDEATFAEKRIRVANHVKDNFDLEKCHQKILEVIKIA